MPQEVLGNCTEHKSKLIFQGGLVNMASHRYQTFKHKGLECVVCGRKGTHFRLQRTGKDGPFHFGLWSNDKVQMTKDHIIPKSKGGPDHIDNYQPMCEICNCKLGSKDER